MLNRTEQSMIGLGGRDEARSHERAYPGVAMWVPLWNLTKPGAWRRQDPFAPIRSFMWGTPYRQYRALDKFHSVYSRIRASVWLKK